MRSYNLRGTNGSGKTYVARQLIELSRAQPILFKGRKPQVYKGILFNEDFYILGSYETQCGGCDTISSVAEVAELLRMLMTNSDDPGDFDLPSLKGIVFFEGLMISHMLGTVGAMQAKLGKEQNVLAFLDTPLDVCIDRVKARRVERGDLREFDPKNVAADHPRVQSCRNKAIRDGYRTVVVYHEEALQNVLEDLELLAKGDFYRRAVS